MEFIKITSKCKDDTNVELRCEFCGNTEMVYGKDTDAWYASIPRIHCIKCQRFTNGDRQGRQK